MPKTNELTVVIDKLVHGGQGLGTLENGKKALVWGVLPGEKVSFQVLKKRKDYVEGVVSRIIKSSPERIEPRDELFLSTSPWQIMSFLRENEHKNQILTDTLTRGVPSYDTKIEFITPKQPWNYRNKMEYSFFGDDQGLHLSLFNRGTHRKQIVEGSSLARPEIDIVANKICSFLGDQEVRAGDLKSLTIRSDEAGNCVAALYVREEKFPRISKLEGLCKGIVVCFSNPKSPASVRTRDLYKFGDISLNDRLLKTSIGYDVFSFFQGNLEIFRNTLQHIKDACKGNKIIDMYSGVGSIGLSIPGTELLVESDANNVVWAKKNTGLKRTAEVVHATSERALEYVDEERVLIVDPPRAGLHRDLIDRIADVRPPKVIYLSCNPSTQARDLALLSDSYKVETIIGYNFFPRTPHIESLAILIKN